MKIIVERNKRINANGDIAVTGIMSIIDGECTHTVHTLEGESTEIATGTYKLGFRTVGGFRNRYIKKFKDIEHNHMLEIKNVPNRKYILIHVGNYVDDTEGCILVGTGVAKDGSMITASKTAYKSIYGMISKHIEQHGEIDIVIKNEGEEIVDEIAVEETAFNVVTKDNIGKVLVELSSTMDFLEATREETGRRYDSLKSILDKM